MLLQLPQMLGWLLEAVLGLRSAFERASHVKCTAYPLINMQVLQANLIIPCNRPSFFVVHSEEIITNKMKGKQKSKLLQY